MSQVVCVTEKKLINQFDVRLGNCSPIDFGSSELWSGSSFTNSAQYVSFASPH